MSGLRTRKRSPQRSVVLVVSVPAKNRSSITSNMFKSATTNILYCNSPILSSHCKGICNTFTSMCNTFRKMQYCIASMCNVCFLQKSAILLKVLRSTLQDTSTTHVSSRPCAGPEIRRFTKSFVFQFSGTMKCPIPETLRRNWQHLLIRITITICIHAHICVRLEE